MRPCHRPGTVQWGSTEEWEDRWGPCSIGVYILGGEGNDLKLGNTSVKKVSLDKKLSAVIHMKLDRNAVSGSWGRPCLGWGSHERPHRGGTLGAIPIPHPTLSAPRHALPQLEASLCHRATDRLPWGGEKKTKQPHSLRGLRKLKSCFLEGSFCSTWMNTSCS